MSTALRSRVAGAARSISTTSTRTCARSASRAGRAAPAKASSAAEAAVQLRGVHFEAQRSAGGWRRHGRGGPGGAGARSLHSTAWCGGKIVRPFNLADIGEGIAEVEVLQWHVEVGDEVDDFDPLCEVQSDKATVEITSRYAGVIKKLYYETGDMAATGLPLCDIECDDDDGEGGGAPEPEPEPVPAPAAAAPAATTPGPPAVMGAAVPDVYPVDELIDKMGKVLTTPAVRRMAREHNIDLSAVTPTGKEGRILKDDVVAYMSGGGGTAAAAPAGATRPLASGDASEDRTVAISGIARIMVKTMTAATAVPHFTYCDEIDMGALVSLRGKLKATCAEATGVNLTYMPFFIKAASLALNKTPILNAHLNQAADEIVYKGAHNISVAVASPQGLIVPNIKHVQDKSIFEIAEDLARLATLANAGQLGQSDLADGTFALSNIGAIGGTYATPVVMMPQVAIGALGRIQKLPRFAEDGSVVAASVLNASWSADHRVIDGATMAYFGNDWKAYVEEPERMLAELR